MTVDEAIVMLEEFKRARERRGVVDATPPGQVEVYFDCPRCGQAFRPARLMVESVVVKASA